MEVLLLAFLLGGGFLAMVLSRPDLAAQIGLLRFPAHPVDPDTRISQPFREGGDGVERHNGIDFAVPVGTVLFNVAPGVVKSAHSVDDDASGKFVIVQGTGEFAALQWGYAHMSQVDVVPGQALDPGVPVGLSGNTGDTTGPHLHFTVTPIATVHSVDPAPFLVGAV